MVWCVAGLILSGFATFGPKFVQNQFSVSAGKASLIVGKFVCLYVHSYVVTCIWYLPVDALIGQVEQTSCHVLYTISGVWSLTVKVLE